MASEIKVERESYEKLQHLVKHTPPTDPNFRNLMERKAEAFQRDVRAPKLAARKAAKAEAQKSYLLRQSKAVQKSFAETGHA